MKKKDVKVGQLVKLSSVRARWSDFVDISQLGIIIGHDNHARAKVLFTDGQMEEHWYFSLESVNEAT